MSLYQKHEFYDRGTAQLHDGEDLDSRRQICVNSYDRDDPDSSTSSRFQITMERTIKLKKIRLEAASIPLACPVFSVTDGLGNLQPLDLWFEEQAGGGELSAAIPLKVNYSASSFATDMTALMTAASANALTYTVTYDTETMKLTFASTGNFRFRWDLGSYPAEGLGFGRTDSPTAYSNSITSTGIVYFQNDPIIGIRLEGLETCTIDASGNPMTFMLVADGAPGTIMHYRANREFNQWLVLRTQPQVRTLTVSYWRHAKGQLLPMNGLDNQLIISYIPSDGYE